MLKGQKICFFFAGSALNFSFPFFSFLGTLQIRCVEMCWAIKYCLFVKKRNDFHLSFCSHFEMDSDLLNFVISSKKKKFVQQSVTFRQLFYFWQRLHMSSGNQMPLIGNTFFLSRSSKSGVKLIAGTREYLSIRVAEKVQFNLKNKITWHVSNAEKTTSGYLLKRRTEYIWTVAEHSLCNKID